MNRSAINDALGMSEEDQDRRAMEYENDTWDASGLGKVVMGRPRLAEEETRAISVRLPISQIAELDRISSLDGKSRSAAIRAALDSWLKNVAAL